MKYPTLAAALAMGLSGCVAVPYHGDPVPAAGYHHAPAPAVHLRYHYWRDHPRHYHHHYYRR